MNNENNINLFGDTEKAEKWVKAINCRIAQWVGKKNKSYWYLVMWVSKDLCLFEKHVTKKDFCKLLIEECRGSLPEGATEVNVFHSMEKFKYKNDLKDFSKLPEKSNVRKYVEELNELFRKDADEPESFSSDIETILEQHVKESMKNEYQEFKLRPTYDQKTVSMSVETFPNKRFQKQDRPSMTVIYQCYDREVCDADIYELDSIFEKTSGIFKIFVASSKSFRKNVIIQAEKRSIGLIRINPGSRITETNYELPRSTTNGRDEILQRDMLEGKVEMNVPMIISDGWIISSSLAHILHRNYLPVSRSSRRRDPILTNAEIEAIANTFTQEYVNDFKRHFHDGLPSANDFSCSINPYEIAIARLGFYIRREEVGNIKSYINCKTKHVVLNRDVECGSATDRFSLAHETGHYVLHAALMLSQDYNYATLDSCEKKWFEHHANTFASCLLMPADIVRPLYEYYFRKVLHTDTVKPLEIKGSIDDDIISRRIVEPIAWRMKVSVKAAMIRLVKMGLAVETEAA